MSKTKIKNIENESKDAKFRRIANPRAKKIIYELNRLCNMPKQPTYEILDVDAEKLQVAIAKAYNEFNELYNKLASGQTIKAGKKELGDIF